MSDDPTPPLTSAEQLAADARLLADIERVVAEIDRVIAERDDLIRRAMGTKLRRADIAAAAKVGESRLYQILDGRR